MSGLYLLYLLFSVCELYALALATDVLAGHLGRIGVGAVFFSAVGAFGYSALAAGGVLPPWAAFAVAMVFANLVAVLLLPVLSQVSAETFLLVTFALLLASSDLVKNIKTLGGAVGIRNVPQLSLGTSPSGASAYALLALAVSCGALFAWRALGPRRAVGRALWNIRDDVVSARISGVPVQGLFLGALVVEATLGAMAGIARVTLDGYAGPATFDLHLAIVVLAAVLVGGTAGSSVALMAGSAVLLGLEEWLALAVREPRLVGPFQNLLLNGVLLTVIVFRPRGVLGPRIEHP